MTKAVTIDLCVPLAGGLIELNDARKEEAIQFTLVVAVVCVELQPHPRSGYDSLRFQVPKGSLGEGAAAAMTTWVKINPSLRAVAVQLTYHPQYFT
jgi:hypothetical protein